MYNSGNSSKNVTGSNIIDGTVETVDIADDAVTADKLANSVNTDIATGVSGSTTAGDALPKAGGAMTGAITTNSTFDGVDVATRDGILTTTTATANDALPKTGGALTGAVTTNSTFDGRDVAADGVTADAALPKAGGTMTGTIAGFTSTGIDDNATSTAITIDASENVTLTGSLTTEKLTLEVGGGVNGQDLTSVSTTATNMTAANDFGQLTIIAGNSGGNIFTDLVFWATTMGAYVIKSGTVSGGPAGRTYTVVASKLKLAMASGTYAVSSTSLKGTL
jgi:hypothetical protein